MISASTSYNSAADTSMTTNVCVTIKHCDNVVVVGKHLAASSDETRQHALMNSTPESLAHHIC